MALGLTRTYDLWYNDGMSHDSDNKILQAQIAHLPYQTTPISMKRDGKGGMQIVNNLSLDEPITEEKLRDAWADPKYFKGKWTAQKAIAAYTTMSIECGQMIDTKNGVKRLMGLDIDRDDEKLIEIVRHSLVRAGVNERFEKTGEYKLSELVGKKGSKGVTYFCLVPDGLKQYKQKLLDGDGEEVGDVLYYRGDKRGGEKRPQQCYFMGDHKSFKTENKYRWTGRSITDVAPEDLPQVSAAWLFAIHTQIEANGGK